MGGMRIRLTLAGTLTLALLFAACSGKEASPATGGDGSGDSNETAATATPTKPARLGIPTGVAYRATEPTPLTPLDGATTYAGLLGSASYYIEVPDVWNGELVMFAHGYRGESTTLSVSAPNRALRSLFIEQGYAWAASSYSENSYAPGIGADDTLALKRFFEKEHGEAKRTYLYGESMGGNVIALSLEHYGDEYDGALAVCGAMGGQEQMDYLAAWAMLAEYFSGQEIPIGEGPARLNTTMLLGLSNLLGSPAAPTPKGAQFISSIRELTGGARPFFLEGFDDQYIANFAFLLIDPSRKLPVTLAATNDYFDFEIAPGLGVTNEQLNAGVRRIPADPAYRDANAYPDRVPTTAKISDPLLTLHNTGDLFVPISQEIDYRGKAEAAGTGDLLVQRAIRAGGHCRFSAEEVSTAWNDLVNWVEVGERPGGDDLTGDLSDIGKAYTNPLRPGDPGTR